MTSSAVASGKILVLVLEPDNPSNTRLIDKETGEIWYTVQTHHTEENTTTKVTNSDDEQIGQWVWNDVRSDILTLGKGEPNPASVWLRKSMVPFKDTVHFTDLQGRNFKWKNNSPGLSLELYSDKDKRNPVARFKKSFRYKDVKTMEEVYDPATLTIGPMGQEILDMVVISFCLLEKDRRVRAHGIASMASSLAVAPKVV